MSDQVVTTQPTGSVMHTVGNLSNLPKLNGKNFQSWKELVEIVLTLRGLKKAIQTMASTMSRTCMPS